MIKTMIESSFLLPIPPLPGSTGFRGSHQSRGDRIKLTIFRVIPILISILPPSRILLQPSRKLLAQGRIIPVQGDSSWSLVIMTIVGAGPSILFPSPLKLSWRIVQSYWHFNKPCGWRLHCLWPSPPSKGSVALSLISSYLFTGFS